MTEKNGLGVFIFGIIAFRNVGTVLTDGELVGVHEPYVNLSPFHRNKLNIDTTSLIIPMCHSNRALIITCCTTLSSPLSDAQHHLNRRVKSAKFLLECSITLKM